MIDAALHFDLCLPSSNTYKRARELGLRVRSDMPENVLRLMQLNPQPMRR
jgi:hypothetical protein